MKLREVGKPALSVPAWQSRFARRERAEDSQLISLARMD